MRKVMILRWHNKLDVEESKKKKKRGKNITLELANIYLMGIPL